MSSGPDWVRECPEYVARLGIHWTTIGGKEEGNIKGTLHIRVSLTFFFLYGAPAHIGPRPPLYEVP
jgi:hypothetical protein